MDVTTVFDRVARRVRAIPWPARVREYVTENKKGIYIALIALAIIVPLIYVLLRSGTATSNTEPRFDTSNSTAAPVIVINRTLDDDIRHPFWTKTLQALTAGQGGRVIYSAFVDEENRCMLTLSASHQIINEPLEAKCSNVDHSPPTLWTLGRPYEAIFEGNITSFQLSAFSSNVSFPKGPTWRLNFCLTVPNAYVHYLTVSVCERNDPPVSRQQFTIKVEKTLFSMAEKWSRVYFTIRSEGEQCIGLNVLSENGPDFLLEPCSDVKSNQLFFLNDVDYTKEFENYYMKKGYEGADLVKTNA